MNHVFYQQDGLPRQTLVSDVDAPNSDCSWQRHYLDCGIGCLIRQLIRCIGCNLEASNLQDPLVCRKDKMTCIIKQEGKHGVANSARLYEQIHLRLHVLFTLGYLLKLIAQSLSLLNGDRRTRPTPSTFFKISIMQL